LKKALIEERQERGEPVSVSEVEADYTRLQKEREIRRNIERMRHAGARVRYYQADVCDESSMERVFQSVYGELGQLDVVIHGAGTIEDKLIDEKSLESFDRVFDTKAVSAFILSRLVRPESLKCMLFFASAAGTFGNRGQADYAAANEILNHLASELDRRWPGRVAAINWGPWKKTGMVSPELEREFAKRGVELIPIPTGCRILDQEIRCGAKGDVQVLVAGGVWGEQREIPQKTGPEEVLVSVEKLPLIVNASIVSRGGPVIEAERVFDPSRDLYLMDHQMDETPVLPLAVATELAAEVAQYGWPDLKLVGLRDLRVLKGIVIDNGPKKIRIVSRAQVEPPHDRLGVDVHAEIRDADGSGPYYRATVEMADTLPEPPGHRSPFRESLEPFPMTVKEAYRKWLFHGPMFQGITEIEGIGRGGVSAILKPSSPRRCLNGTSPGQWLIDPVIFDSGLQLFLVWARAHLDKTPLPAGFSRYRRYGSLSGSEVFCHLKVLDKSRDPVFYLDISFFGPDGRLLGSLEEAEGACSRSLNRLGGQWLSKKSESGIGSIVGG
jgi:NAD(P)-dependent dehydrogenase (short-subunit alcohol dehydrogenase family)